MTSFTISSNSSFRVVQPRPPQETSTQAIFNPPFFLPPPPPHFLMIPFTPPMNDFSLVPPFIMDESLAFHSSAPVLAFPPTPPMLLAAAFPSSSSSTSTTTASSSSSSSTSSSSTSEPSHCSRKRNYNNCFPISDLLNISRKIDEESSFFSPTAVQQLNDTWRGFQSQIRELIKLRLENLQGILPAHVVTFENPCPETVQLYSKIFRAVVVAGEKMIKDRSSDTSHLKENNPKNRVYYRETSAKALLLSQQNVVKFIMGQEGIQNETLIKYLLRNYEKKDLPSRIEQALRDRLKKFWEFVNGGKTWNTKTHQRSERIRAQNNNFVTDAYIQKLILEENFEKIPIIIENLKTTHAEIKKLTFPIFSVIERSTIIYEKNSGRIVALFKKNFHDASIAKSIRDKLRELEGNWPSYANQKEIYIGQYNRGKKIKSRTNKLINTFKSIHALHTKAFAEFLPQTFANALQTTRVFRDAEIVFDSTIQSPFTTVKITRSIAEEKNPRHRGSYFYPFTVTSSFCSNESATVPVAIRFFELFQCAESKEKGEKAEKAKKAQDSLPISFLLSPGDVLIADTEYVHEEAELSQNLNRFSFISHCSNELSAPIIIPNSSSSSTAAAVALSSNNNSSSSSSSSSSAAAAAVVEEGSNSSEGPSHKRRRT